MAGPRTWRHESLAPGRGPAAVLLVAALAAGCKSGTWGAKPSWWSFGGSPPATSLTAAPEFKQDVTKPSEAAKPYPTTETPEAYSLAGASQAAAGQTAASANPAMEPMSVTYGSTPPPAEPQPQALAQPTAQAAGLGAQPAGIGPQVGPYASLQPAPPSAAGDPAAAATAGLAAAPAFGEASPPAAAPRMADARGSDAWAASPPPAGTDPRYGASPGSRFSSGFQPAAIEPPPAAAPFAPPAATASPPPAAPPTSPPATSIDPAPAAAGLPAAPADALPGSLPPPRRRPDPGYRPGGTSSYRPSRSILADDEAAAGGVMPASFDVQTPGP